MDLPGAPGDLEVTDNIVEGDVVLDETDRAIELGKEAMAGNYAWSIGVSFVMGGVVFAQNINFDYDIDTALRSAIIQTLYSVIVAIGGTGLQFKVFERYVNKKGMNLKRASVPATVIPSIATAVATFVAHLLGGLISNEQGLGATTEVAAISTIPTAVLAPLGYGLMQLRLYCEATRQKAGAVLTSVFGENFSRKWGPKLDKKVF